jgi:8-oxo-dGTP pyrophosphatase MutT (NUDIX family)
MFTENLFYIKTNNKINKYNSAGVCFYSDSEETKIMLLKKNNNKWEFLGGKIEKNDISLLHTAIREGVEESNGCITGINNSIELDFHNIINDILFRNETTYWYPYPKYNYGLFFIKINNNMIHDSDTYGNKELFENQERTIHWLTISEINSLISDKKNLNFEVDYFILSKMKNIIKNPNNYKFLEKWEINKNS